MTISLIVNPVFTYGKEGWEPDDDFLGGTEESVVEWSRRLKTLGYDVIVYKNGKEGTWHGVPYLDRSKYQPKGLTINFNSSDIPRQEPTWYFTNQTNAKDLDLSGYDGVLVPSKWALDNLGISHPNIQVLPHGYNHHLIYPKKKIAYQCLYASSPDRGLEELLNHWPEIITAVPEATLIVTYGGAIDLPGVMNMGKVDEETMNELYNTSQFWLHPCTGAELYCISAIKAQAALAVPIYYPTMALSETVRWGVRANRNNFSQRVIKAMQDKKYLYNLLAHAKIQELPYPNWDTTTVHLLRLIGLVRF